MAAGEELVHALLAQAAGVDLDVQPGIDLQHLPGRDDALVQTQVVHPGPQPVQVGQAQVVEVGELERTADALHREGQRRAAAHRQADHTHPAGHQLPLLRTLDPPPVAIRSHQPELLARQQVHQPTRPRVPGPHSVLARIHTGQLRLHGLGQGRTGQPLARVTALDQLLELVADRVEGFADLTRTEQGVQRATVLGAVRLEQHRPPARRVPAPARGHSPGPCWRHRRGRHRLVQAQLTGFHHDGGK